MPDFGGQVVLEGKNLQHHEMQELVDTLAEMPVKFLRFHTASTQSGSSFHAKAVGQNRPRLPQQSTEDMTPYSSKSQCSSNTVRFSMSTLKAI
jgi:hypothetical protein